MDVREKLVEMLQDGDDPVWGWFPNNATMIQLADYLIAHGVTVQEWISVKDRVPEENEYVMIWCGECQIAKIEKGISEVQRNAMKDGEIDAPVATGWASSSGYFQLKRSESYRACDEGFNNKVRYCWSVNGGMMKLFGQNVTHWTPLPEPPKGE